MRDYSNVTGTILSMDAMKGLSYRHPPSNKRFEVCISEGGRIIIDSSYSEFGLLTTVGLPGMLLQKLINQD